MDHDRVLYIGNNKAVIEHLNNINLCHTYWVKTSGMIHHDFKTIEDNYFGLTNTKIIEHPKEK